MRGEEDEYEAFFREQYPRVLALLIAFYRFAPETAKDAASDAMIKLYLNWSKVRTPRAWVRTVALRSARRMVNRRYVQLDTEVEVADGDLAAVELAMMAGAAITALPPRQQEVMRLTLVDLTPTEIADVLGCTAEQARGNLACARRTLRRVLRTEEEA
ncbi:RNA polymerase sigma factor [Streptomyces geranii]|uniref:RNA polymerase sigma factor n=1 Tax=Streptomyces geranii TaxID=2058923 RepID=UPI000D045B17|nr:sigma-70 family RNA polymerase sigma factor [Streptomyces geranii]